MNKDKVIDFLVERIMNVTIEFPENLKRRWGKVILDIYKINWGWSKLYSLKYYLKLIIFKF